jgi:hypothetical protein
MPSDQEENVMSDVERFGILATQLLSKTRTIPAKRVSSLDMSEHGAE